VDEPYLSSASELPPGGWRGAARSIALEALSLRRRDPSPGVRIVHYHHVFPDELDGFRRHLDYFNSAFEPTTLGAAAARLHSDTTTGRELVVTFDDGFRNTFQLAAPELESRGLRACFYVITDLVSAPRATADRICRERLHLPAAVEPLTWEDVAALAASGHEIGSHTRSHRDPTTLNTAELDAELAGSKVELEDRTGVPVVHASAPYGDRRRFGPAVSGAARRAGYATCAGAQRGLNRSASDLYALKRHHLLALWPVSHVRYFLTRP
jgi:peptidoglycan/xylan/chitin deacetylase (PgdA/CDA1 family)